jgi:phosphate-selective porin
MRVLSLVLVAAMVGGVVPATMHGQAATTAPASKSANTAKAPAVMPTDAEIADAKAKGMVWANENTKVYHKDDAQYGKTKHGKFMTESDAQAAGYRLAKASPVGNKKSAAPAATPPQ